MFWEKKCPYCRGTNLYIRRTSPVLKYGCRDCDKKIEKLRGKGLSDREIKELLER